jgi:exopolysaccharide biosynthesis polyprenyl glycosylphosphotransferase
MTRSTSGKAPEPANPSQVRNLPADLTSFAHRFRTDPLSTIITVSIDLLSASAASAAAFWWASKTYEHTLPPWVMLLFAPLVVAILALRSVYRRWLNRLFLDEIGPVLRGIALASMILLSAISLLRLSGVIATDEEAGRLGLYVLTVGICAAVLMSASRLTRITVQRVLRRRHILISPVLIVGNGLVAYQIIERLKAFPQYGLVAVGLVDAEPPWAGPAWRGPAPDIAYAGTPDNIEEAIERTGAEGIVIAFSLTHDSLLTEVVDAANRNGLRIWVVPRMFDFVGRQARIEHVGGLPLLAMSCTNPRSWQFALKHLSDRIIAGIVLALVSPLFLTLMVLVRLSSPGPIFFRQKRVGRDGKVFDCLKFRTMRQPSTAITDFDLKAGAAPGGVEGVDRRTTVGKVMRTTSMDELPQLLNVLKGDMSLVGPRPERPEYDEQFGVQIRRYDDRHRVKSGITGWAQVHGLRGQTSIADRAEWDNYYIENWSLMLDLKILALTIPAVLRGAE